MGQFNHLEPSTHKLGVSAVASPTVYWRVEGSLLDLTVVEPVAFFTWNAQTFAERFRRRGLIFLMAALRPFLYSTNRKFATRVVHTSLRGVTRDRLDLLGEEYFNYKLKPRLKAHGVERVQELVSAGADVVLVSQGLEHVMKPLAQHLGVKRLVANRLEFRDGVATGRLLEPVIRPRGAFARIQEQSPDGRRAPKTLARQLDITVEELRAAAIASGREVAEQERPIVHFEGQRQAAGRTQVAAAAWLLVLVLALLVADYFAIYLPIVGMIVPVGRARPEAFAAYHRASMVINFCDVALCALAAVFLCWHNPQHNVASNQSTQNN